jgi:hypothetical protein
LHFWRVRRVLSSVRPLRASFATLSLPHPWRLWPLRCAEMTRSVNRPRAAANFFQDPPLPWVPFLRMSAAPYG